MTLAGKTALVTRSATDIGLRIAGLLAKAGANIALNGMGDAAKIEAAPWEAKFDPVMGVVLHE
jgi:3-hydroxybutyrate dehydrogenase